jgi:hypothetical protein
MLTKWERYRSEAAWEPSATAAQICLAELRAPRI